MPISAAGSGRTRIAVRVVEDGRTRRHMDMVATEEPLEIRIEIDGRAIPVAVTMRTPGADFELAAGFLFTEGVIARAEDLPRIGYCLDAAPDGGEVLPPALGADEGLPPALGADDWGLGADARQQLNVVTAELRPGLAVDFRRLERHFQVSSACGVCGKASLEQLDLRGLAAPAPGPVVAAELIYGLPDSLRADQGLFDATGGLHAAGLFDAAGHLVALREDVGRHNALDKLIGWALFNRRLPLSGHIVMVSGRSSFEIMQKSLAAGAPIVCSVSAPSSLAVEVAARFGMTLVGFVRGRRFNVYAGGGRVGG
jgi:FdhD protein